VPADVVVTVVLAYKAKAAGKTSGCVKLSVVVKAAVVVDGVTAVTAISCIRKAVVPSHIQMPTSCAALTVDMLVPTALTWIESILNPLVDGGTKAVMLAPARDAVAVGARVVHAV
tara:strand:- start:2887 stop:3231 length:345 start_codon:yes stop_codon:yes gene_type:complete